MKTLMLVSLLCLPTWTLADVNYTVVPLVPSDLNAVGSIGNGINRYGDVAGSFSVSVNAHRIFSYTDMTGFSDLGLLPSIGIGSVSGINDAGQVAAYSTVNGDGRTHVLRYTPGVGLVDLGTGGGIQAESTRINNSGQITGSYELNDGSERAFRYTDGSGFEDLGVLSGQNSVGRGINDLGWVTGTSGNRAFIYNDQTGMTDVGPGSGWAINNAGVVAGGVSGWAAIYRDGQVQYLWAPGSARGINNNNIVVGSADVTIDGFTYMHAFTWSEQEGVQDLNSLIDPQSGWFLASATGINDNGQIVGWGFGPSGHGPVQTAFRLDPVPEPSTWALLAVGGALAFVFCRKRRR